MKTQTDFSIVELCHYIRAARDAGYRSISAAIAELIDNSFEAHASRVDIRLTESNEGASRQVIVAVCDDGVGMSPSTLRSALRFGGTTRFNSRRGMGRYGMGLPNSSLSQARRVDVYTWTAPKTTWWSYLDVDEIASGRVSFVPMPKRRRLPVQDLRPISDSGTVIIWSRCDRLEGRAVKSISNKLQKLLGRIFRRHLWDRKIITINGHPVQPVDALFIKKGGALWGAIPYGKPLKYEIEIPRAVGRFGISTVTVKFSELPIDRWQSYSNEEKKSYGISKNAGVSILRLGREIDYGWFFMGAKRKENYDDWWRCEIEFGPELDELFGVTNNKQGINPTDLIKEILTPDIEKTAHGLNARVRKGFAKIRAELPRSPGQSLAESKDHLIAPPAQLFDRSHPLPQAGGVARRASRKSGVTGLGYRIEHSRLDDSCFFVPVLNENEVVVRLNEKHPFFRNIYAPTLSSPNTESRAFKQYLELVLFAIARAEFGISDRKKLECVRKLREAWSKTLAAFLS